MGLFGGRYFLFLLEVFCGAVLRCAAIPPGLRCHYISLVTSLLMLPVEVILFFPACNLF
jgi:hypothetical protein